MNLIAEIVYALCTLTALACAMLLARGYQRTRARILFWSALCFAFLTLNNFLLFVDLILLPGPDFDLRPLRDLAGFLAMIVLVIGLIWDAD
jgi:drug/metabolite transporter (DMT)-like permease